jgi:hypothetical protein
MLKDCGCEKVDYLIDQCTAPSFWEYFDRRLWEEKGEIKPISGTGRIKEIKEAIEEGVCLGVPTVYYGEGKCQILDGQKRIGVSKMLGRKEINVLKLIKET